MKKRVTKDFETRSAADLRKVGAYLYSLHPTTQPTCLAFKIHGNPTVYFLPFEVVNRPWRDQDPKLKKLWTKLIAEGYEFSAHNSFFERCIYDNILVKRYGWPAIDPRARRCTASKAAACALPRNLEGAGGALRLSSQKDRYGYVAMMATCKPTKKWNAWKSAVDKVRSGARVAQATRKRAAEPEPPMFLEPEAAPDVWSVLYRYCKMDVRAEEALDDALPDLMPQELEVWHLNQKLNWRGLRLDIPTVRKVIGIMEEERAVKTDQLDTLTAGLITKPGAVKAILEFLEIEGVVLPNLQKKTIEDALENPDLSLHLKDLLEIRKALSMASTKKYYAFLERTGDDHRARDLSLYHGASTGRSGGTGINPYNFPRGLIPVDKSRPYASVENVVSEEADMLRLLYGDSLGILFSAILRNMIVPSPGCELFVADFSKIEVAVLWWLADHERGLELLRSGRDVYRDQAASNLGVAYEEVAEEGDDRQLGKAQILGCGFYMSWKRFMESAWSMYRLKLTKRQSLQAVKNYREKHRPVVDLWRAYEDAAVGAVEAPGKTYRAGKCRFVVKRGFLWIYLPSGRPLAYYQPEIVMRAVTYTALETDRHGEDVEIQKTSNPKKTIQFLGLDKTKKKLQVEFLHGGILTENIVQGSARDLMMPGLLRLEESGYTALMEVYDEAVCERKIGEGSVKEFQNLLCLAPEWAVGMPIEAKGWAGPRYRK